jgi:transposase InsO family protein
MTEARVVINQWLEEYNTIRPHGSLNGMNPANSLKKIGLEEIQFSNPKP